MKLHSISSMSTVNSVQDIQALNTLGIHSVRDMAAFTPGRHAQAVVFCFDQGDKQALSTLKPYLDLAKLPDELKTQLDKTPIFYLYSVNEASAKVLRTVFKIESMRDLAEFPPYLEALDLVEESIRGPFYEKPSAPAALIPKPIGSTHTQVRFSNYVKEEDYQLDDYQLTHLASSDEPSPADELINIFYRPKFKFHLGYLAALRQKWVNAGTHLGEIIHSVALAPGESRNIAVLDWFRRQRSSRSEDTTVAEELKAEFLQTRALNEVVQTTANEHLSGSTEVDASTKTTGAGLVGGKSNVAAAAGSVAVDLMALIGLPIKASGGSSAASANSIGGSLVYANGSVQGTLKSETSGERTVTGELVQDISDSTVQNASNVRSVMSTVIVEDEQSGRQRAQTRNITNYNHSHALTVQYSEMLNKYRIDTGIDRLCPVLFLPFGPITFNLSLIQKYWYTFRKAIKRALPGKFFEYDQVVKDFKSQNDAFDPSGDLRITRVKIDRTRSYSAPVRVNFHDANPEVTLAVTGYDIDDCMSLKLEGSSTYVSYDVLELASFDESSFGSVDSFEVDEGISARLKSDFMSELKQQMKLYLGDSSKTPHAPVGTLPKNLEDNELGVHSKRDNLKDDVDNGKFTIINTAEKVDLRMDVEYTIEDRNGETQTVFQTLNKVYTYGQLKNEIDEEISDVSDHVNGQISTVSDINPSDTVAEIEQHFNFYKYGYTKYLLANVEKEQIIDIIEQLAIFSASETLALSALVDPNPIGLSENMLIFKLREDAELVERRLGRNFFSQVKGPLFSSDNGYSGNGVIKNVVRKGKKATQYTFASQPVSGGKNTNYTTSNMTLYVYDSPKKGGTHNVEGTINLISNIKNKQYTNPVTLTGSAKSHGGKSMKIDYNAVGALDNGLSGSLDWVFDYPRPSGNNISSIVADYLEELRAYETRIRSRSQQDMVFLPSSGVFAEAILGLSNASEYVNPRRFYNWQDSPIPNLAPALLPINVNQDYSQPVSDSVNPTVPVSVLNQIAPTQYPMPTSLNAALDAVQNGSMFTDMSKTSQLTAILGSLAELANNSAQLAGNLAGDAAKNTLDAALGLGQTVAGMVGGSMSNNIADPPKTPTQQAGALELLEEIEQDSNGNGVLPTDQAAANALGAPIPLESSGTAASNGNGRTWIYPGADLTAENRAFLPSTHDITGITRISVSVPDLPAGGAVHWSVAPGEAGNYALDGGNTTHVGERVEITGHVPGMTKIDVEARDAGNHVLESLKLDLCIPQFVQIKRDPAFDAVLKGYGLVDAEIDEVLREARASCEIILDSANVRLLWPVDPFNDAIPAQFQAGGAAAANITTVSLLGHPPRPTLAGATPGNASPTRYNEAISVWIGAYEDSPPAGTKGWDIDQVTQEVIPVLTNGQFTSSDDKTRAIEIYGRLLARTMSHEIIHSLLGTIVSPDGHTIPAVPGDLMNRGFESTFEDKTAFEILGQVGDGALTTWTFDKGREYMSVPTGAHMDEINKFFPVPPAFK